MILRGVTVLLSYLNVRAKNAIMTSSIRAMKTNENEKKKNIVMERIIVLNRIF